MKKLLSILCMIISFPAMASTLAGTTISNQASLEYSVVGSASKTTTQSNVSTFVVNELIDVQLLWTDASQIAVNSPDTKKVLTFKITNTGNGNQNYNLTSNNNIGGGNFNPIINGTTIYVENGLSSGLQLDGAYKDKEYVVNDSLLLGGEYRFSDIPLKINGQVNYTENPNLMNPKKFLIGSEYAFNNNLVGVADKQFNDYGSGITSNINRVGLKYKPWTGGQIQSYVGNDTGVTPNKFYQFGIDQNLKYKLWSFDLGFAKQTWDKQVSATQIPAGKLITQDNFNSYNFGATYRNEPFVYQFKAEQKTGSLENKTHLTNNIYRKIDDELSYSVGQDYLKVNSNTTNGFDTTTENIRGGLSYRGKNNTIFGRLDWINQNQNNQNSAKYVLNIHDNYKPNYDLEIYSHLGYKYVVTTFDQDEYKGSSYLLSGGIRKYLNKDWDIVVQGLYASSPSVNTVSKGYGVSLGYNLFKNAWVSVGYQKLNSYDRNYSFDDAYINGWFIKFRIKFDEETFHLNKQETIK